MFAADWVAHQTSDVPMTWPYYNGVVVNELDVAN